MSILLFIMGVANSKTLSQSFLSHFFEYLCCTIRVKKNDFILKIYYTINQVGVNRHGGTPYFVVRQKI